MQRKINKRPHLEFLQKNAEGQLVAIEVEIAVETLKQAGLKKEALAGVKVQIDALKEQEKKVQTKYDYLCELLDSESVDQEKQTKA